MPKSNPYFPCTLVEHDGSYSLICSHFHYFDDHFRGREAGGYAVERLAKKLAKEHGIEGVRFDSEAGMFCAYADKKRPLQMLSAQLRKITGSQRRHLPRDASPPDLSPDEAEQLLLRGFVLRLDADAQQRFFQHVPCPPLTPQQAELMRMVRTGSEGEQLKAARKINSEARTLVRQPNHYLSHPSTTGLLLESCDAHRERPAVVQELIWALVFICERHLPDLRIEPYFLAALEDKRQQMRILGLWGLNSLGALTAAVLKPLLADKSARVRAEAKKHAPSAPASRRTFASWMFDAANVKRVRAGK